MSNGPRMEPRVSLYLAARRHVGALLRQFPEAKRVLVRIEAAILPRNASLALPEPGAPIEPRARIPARCAERVAADLERAIRHRIESAKRPT